MSPTGVGIGSHSFCKCWTDMTPEPPNGKLGIALFGKDRVRDDWRSYSEYLRSRICRAIRTGVALRDGGHRHLPRGLPLRSKAANDNESP